MRRGLCSTWAVLTLGAAVWVGSQSGSAQDSSAASPAPARFDYTELANAPEKARVRKNPMEADATAALVGRKLFAQHCAECHGASGEGSRKAPSLKAMEVQKASPGALFWILTNGVVRRGMPVWSKLPERQRWQLVSYIKNLDAASSPISTHQPAPEATQP